MKQRLLLLLTTWLVASGAWAQTKVFKEVSEEISSQVAAIRQDNSLVGYLVFTRLEKASEDSFNYKITIMDENLNDIGTVNFREESIYLQGVAFEQDVLCMAYFKTNVFGKKFKGPKDYKESEPKFKNQIMLQFLGLNGKILKTNFLTTKINTTQFKVGRKESYAQGKLRANTQLINIPQYGFACAFGDDDKNLLAVYSASGARLWEKKLKADVSNNYDMISSGGDIYMILQSKEKIEKDFWEVYSFGVKDSVEYPKYALKDKKGHGITVLTFDNNAETGKPYICGYLSSSNKAADGSSAKGIARGYYAGYYSYHFNGHGKNDVKEVYSYWDDGSNASMSAKGRYEEKKLYLRPSIAFKDFTGNTYFINNSFVKRPRIGCIISSVLTSFMITPPIMILVLGGTQKAKLDNPVLVKMDPKGNLSFETPIETKGNKFSRANLPVSWLGFRDFSTATNTETKTNYLIMRDNNNSTIYNLTKKKIERTIPTKAGIRIVPAKDGHIMVVEYNKAEKYTRVSIEAL